MWCYANAFTLGSYTFWNVSLARNLSHMCVYYIHVHVIYMYGVKVNANTGVYYPVPHSLCSRGLCVWPHWFTCCYVCGQNTDCWGLYQKISPAKYNLTLTLKCQKWNFSKYGNFDQTWSVLLTRKEASRKLHYSTWLTCKWFSSGTKSRRALVLQL